MKSVSIRRGFGGFRAYVGREAVGGIVIREAPGKALRVIDIFLAPDARHKGIGTLLYEAALQHACSSGLRLTSGFDRTPFSEYFWRKQVRKGRAECLTKNLARGRDFNAHTIDKPVPRSLPKPLGKRREAYWPCKVYGMKRRHCADGSLRGIR